LREVGTVIRVTTLLDRGDVLMVRCDSCRRLWPVARERLISAGWAGDGEDRHTCPACTETASPAEAVAPAHSG
jgi:hypothetical protein